MIYRSLCTLFFYFIFYVNVIAQPADRPPHPPELTSSPELIQEQNRIADALNIPRVTQGKNGNFGSLKKSGELVRLTNTKCMTVAMRRRSHPYVAPQLKEILEFAAERFYLQTKKKMPTISGLRFHETRPEGSMHRRGLAADITCRYMTEEEKLILRAIFIDLVRKDKRVQVAEESSVAIWQTKRINYIVAFHVVVLNASFLEKFS